MKKSINYIGLDVHKKNITVAESVKSGEANFVGEYPNSEAGIKKMLKMFAKKSKNHELKTCYEAGPCGYALKRILDKTEIDCEVIAPSLIPTKAGDRIKTDKRDAEKLAKYYRAGELTLVKTPGEKEEAVRDVVRSRGSIVSLSIKTKQELNHFLLRHGYIFPGKTNWTKQHIEWIRVLKLENKNLNYVKNTYFNLLTQLGIQLKDIEEQIEEISKTEEYHEKVEVLKAFKGIKNITAMIILTEVIDFKRFNNPKHLMSYLGLVPSEYSSGGKIKKGSITKCGNNRVRKALIETSWHYAKNKTISRRMKEQMQKIPIKSSEEPTKALYRLNKKYYSMIFKGKSKQTAIVSVARELVGFIWSSMMKLEQMENKNFLIAS